MSAEQARGPFAGTPRPRQRWFHAASELENFAIVSFRVEAAVVARHLPPGFIPTLFPFADGVGALVSAVAFRDDRFHFRFFPPAAINCGQINYRAYVTAPDGTRGVWFFQTSLGHPVVAIPRLLWRMPWVRERIAITGEWDARPARWALEADDAACVAVEESAPAASLDGFGGSWLEPLTHPTVGWYARPDGAVGSYSVWHPVMQARHFAAETASFPVFERLGLIEPGTEPHSVLVQPRIHFDIHTPPRRYAGA